MYLRPKRMKTGLMFVGGLSVSVVLLAGGAWWYGTQRQLMEQAAYEKARTLVEAEWVAAHPMEPAYVFARDMTAGSTIAESDLLLMDIGVDTLPADAVLKPEALLGRVVRADVRAKTLCTGALLYRDEDYPDDARIQEYTAIRLPSRLEKNQAVDVRVTFPNGLDYVVLAKKTVQDLERGEEGNSGLIWLTMQENELLRMASAMVDAYLHPGTVLYAVTYVAPDIQKAAVCTYPANEYVQDLIRANPNIVECAVTELERANRKWFDTIPDPQPQQPMAVVPVPGALQSSGAMKSGSASSGTDPAVMPESTESLSEGATMGAGQAGAEMRTQQSTGEGGGLSSGSASSLASDGTRQGTGSAGSAGSSGSSGGTDGQGNPKGDAGRSGSTDGAGSEGGL